MIECHEIHANRYCVLDILKLTVRKLFVLQKRKVLNMIVTENVRVI